MLSIDSPLDKCQWSTPCGVGVSLKTPNTALYPTLLHVSNISTRNHLQAFYGAQTSLAGRLLTGSLGDDNSNDKRAIVESCAQPRSSTTLALTAREPTHQPRTDPQRRCPRQRPTANSQRLSSLPLISWWKPRDGQPMTGWRVNVYIYILTDSSQSEMCPQCLGQSSVLTRIFWSSYLYKNKSPASYGYISPSGPHNAFLRSATTV